MEASFSDTRVHLPMNRDLDAGTRDTGIIVLPCQTLAAWSGEMREAMIVESS